MLGNYSKKHRLALLTYLILGLALIPSAAHANAGTPLMWAGMFHLLIGNALIGTGEGAIIARLFKVKYSRSIGIMILANYFSAFAGGVILYTFAGNSWIANPTLYTMPKVIWTLVVTSFLLTIVLEWPFCLWILRANTSSAKVVTKTAIIASLIAQVASYGVLVPWYYLISAKSLYTDVDIDRSLSFAKGSPALIYFISAADGAIYRVNADGTNRRKVFDFDIKATDAELRTKSIKNSGAKELWLTDYPNSEKDTLICKDLSADAFLTRGRVLHIGDATSQSYDFHHRISDLRTQNERDWEVDAGFWGYEGITADNRKTHEHLKVAFEAPFILGWFVRDATILPGDQVVYRLGDQIIILDLNRRKIGLLAVGRSPVVTLGGKE